MKDINGREIQVGDLIAWCYQPNDCRPIMIQRPVVEIRKGTPYYLCEYVNSYTNTLIRQKRAVKSQVVVTAGPVKGDK